MTEPRNEFDDLMRRALRAEADQVQPSDDGLHEIRERIARESRPTLASRATRRPWLLTAGGAVLGTAAAIGLFTVLVNRPGPDLDASGPESATSSSPSPETRVNPTTPAVTPAPSTGPTVAPPTKSGPQPTAVPKQRVEPIATRAVPVYWLGDTVGVTRAGPRLYRTFVPIKGRPAYEAVVTMTQTQPDDPDYSSPWLGAKPNQVLISDGLTTVDFGTLPEANLDTQGATIALQQLVYTVQGTLQNQDPVRITLNGKLVRTVFGTGDAAQPIRRAPMLEAQALVWINSPLNGAKVASPVKVSGVAAAFEATVSWQVIDLKSRLVARSGFTNSAEGQVHSAYAFTVDLPAGEYELVVYQASGEDGSITNSDTKTISVSP
ncbi:GerMN domain-containing protein [Kribbella sp. NBC_01245]|uniref:Gmad2 immunoglobulin-like domain-containing protein n=1 Tax=Kribbella sp. NBC_01245 TaxID=2903578 RepID=UPI002E2B059B|nr:Gmad2 immunoglobulin-like domain-containing protein [Kribbella sp. NBC_01245]